MTPLQKLIAELRELAELRPRNLDVAIEQTTEWRAADMLEAQAGENADLKISVVAFAGPAAVAYAKQNGLPDNHLYPHHYDILKNAGARMDEFTRSTLTQESRHD